METARVTAGTRVNDSDVAGSLSTASAANPPANILDRGLATAVGDQRGNVNGLHAPAGDADTEKLEVSDQFVQRHTVYIYSTTRSPEVKQA